MIHLVATRTTEAIMVAKEILVKKYVVRLSDDEREQLAALIRKGSSPAHRLLKARILLKADVSEAGEGWSDNQIIDALATSASMVYRVRKQLVEEGELLDPSTAAAISEVSQTASGALKIKMHDKHAALVSIGKELGMFIERHEHGGPGDFERMSDDDLRQLAMRALGHGAPEGGKPKSARHYRQRRAQLMSGVRRELALDGKAPLEPVQRPVHGNNEWRYFARGKRTIVQPRANELNWRTGEFQAV
jgi:hypothetical protein